MKILILVLILTNISFAGPAGTKGEDGNFKVSEKSLNHLGVKFQKLQGEGPWTISREALVKIKLTLGVYRRFEGEITYVIIKKLNESGDLVTIQSADLQEGDEAAVSGTKFLRMAETDLNSETVDNCAH